MNARNQLIEALCSANPDYASYTDQLKDLARLTMTPYANAVIAAGFVHAPWTAESTKPFDPWADNFTSAQDELEAAQSDARDAKAASAALLELNARIAGLATAVEQREL